MGVSNLILRGIYSYGFEKPSRVQSRAIKAIITKKDCIIQAQSGTGKTGTFVIGTLNNIDFSKTQVQAVVLAPTRELADQIYKVFTNISQYCNIRVSLCVGQMRVDETINTSQIVVGTTGWYGHLQEVKNKCEESNNTLLYASNFSIGVNVFFFVNKMLAKIMNRYPQYEVQVEEIHHTEKLDSPSGTAMTIAEGIISELNRKNEWTNELIGSGEELVPKPDQLLIESKLQPWKSIK
jgi:dihydrodipicolinate reductase